MKTVNPNYNYFEIPGDLPINQRNYFKVLAKCGHVGKGLYFEGKFYVAAETAAKAAERTRSFPRVKHDYRDAIISVTSISYQEYVDGQNFEYNRPYYNCLSKQEQSLYWEEISRDVHVDTSIERIVFVSSKRHSLKNSFNMDPMYQELKLYHGDIDCLEIA